MPAIGSLVGYAQDDLTPNLAAQTANGQTAALSGWGEVAQMRLQLNVTAVSGTTPSMTVQIQDSPDGVNWYNVTGGAFTAVTAVGVQALNITGPVFDKIRAQWTITGTTPSFTFDVLAASYSKLS